MPSLATGPLPRPEMSEIKWESYVKATCDRPSANERHAAGAHDYSPLKLLVANIPIDLLQIAVY